MQFVIALLALLCVSVCATPTSTCTGTPNMQAVWSGTPKLVNKTINGARFLAGFANDSRPLNVVHVYGNPYQMGLAMGQLMRQEIQSLVPQIFTWAESQIAPYVKFLPDWLQAIVEKLGVVGLLDVTFALTKPYQDAYFEQELQGLADGSGMDLKLLQQVSMFPEATAMACSIVGANGPAVDSSLNGQLVQLRALDWGSDAPVSQHPLLAVYHPTKLGHEFFQLGWPGLVGAVTGGSKFLFQSEKVWDHSNSKNPRTGIPATFLIRNILQFDETMEQALNRIHTANRTCAFFLGLGERQTSDFCLVENSFQYVNVYNWSDFPAYAGHPLREGLVFVDKHTQPSNWDCMQGLMNVTYGSFTAHAMFQQVTALAQTGDQHIAVFDQANDQLYVAVGAPPSGATPYTPAYNRPFLQFDISALLDQTL